MADLLKTPKEELKKSDFRKEKKKFWHHESLFSHLFLHSIVSFALLIIAIIFLIFSIPLWENILFPGLQKIDPIQRDLTILQAKLDQLTQNLQNIQDKEVEIEIVKKHLSALQQTVTGLEKDFSKPPLTSAQAVHDSNPPQNFVDLRPLWEKLQRALQAGEGCAESLNQLKSKIPSSLETPLQTLVPFTEIPTKSLSTLQRALENIDLDMKNSPTSHEIVVISQSDSWWHVVWDYLSKWIHVRTLNKKASEVSFLTTVEQALEFLRKNQLGSSIEYLQSLHSIEEIRNWLAEAKRRQQCDQVIADFEKELERISQSGNGQ